MHAGTAEWVSAGMRHVGFDEYFHADGAGEFVERVLLCRGFLLFDGAYTAVFLYLLLLFSLLLLYLFDC